MLPPSPMLTIKNRGCSGLAGRREHSTSRWPAWRRSLCCWRCWQAARPPGPRALLEGKRLMEEGKYPQASREAADGHGPAGRHQRAGVELSGPGLPSRRRNGRSREGLPASAGAEPRSERGALQSRLPLAGAEQARGGQERVHGLHLAPAKRCSEGFLKLGAVQLRAHEPSAAEKSFSEALRLSPQNPEALNGLGLARLSAAGPAKRRSASIAP